MKNIKFISKILVAVLICVFSVGILNGCGKTISSATIINGTIETMLIKDETLDTSSALATITYSDGSTKQVSSSDLTFGTIDTSTVGEKTLNISYNGFNFSVTVTVYASEEDTASIISMESKLLTDYNNNKKDMTNDQEEFYDKTQPLYVGDDNAFNFRISASGVDRDGELLTNIAKVRTDIVVALKNASTGVYEVISDEDLANYVTIDSENATLDFTELSIGEQFKVTVSAVNRDTDYEEAATKFDAYLTVVDGFNVYTAKQLSVYDNTQTDWADIKQAEGLTGVTTNGIILQNNISITANDIPSDRFWKTTDANYSTKQGLTDQTLAGSLIDTYGYGIFTRQVENSVTFNFIGNYFSVSVADLPKMVVEAGSGNSAVNVEDSSYMTGHTCVFYTEAKDSVNTTANTQANWKNIFFIGNGQLNADPLYSGSILLMKIDYVNFNAYNTVTHNFYIGYFMQRGSLTNENNGYYVIDSCKGYDSYNTLFYFWGAKSVTLINSEFKNAGGPVMIVDHVGPGTDGSSGMPSHINVVASTLESKVSGQEPWFTVYGAGALVGQLAGADVFYDGTYSSLGLADTGKTIIADTVNVSGTNVNRMNIIVAMKSGDSASLTAQRIHGYVRMFDTVDDYNAYYGLNGTAQSVTTYGLDMDGESSLMNKAYNTSLIYLQSSGNNGYINSGFGTANQDSSVMTGTSYAEGGYVNVYLYNGMGAMIQLCNQAV